MSMVLLACGMLIVLVLHGETNFMKNVHDCTRTTTKMRTKNNDNIQFRFSLGFARTGQKRPDYFGLSNLSLIEFTKAAQPKVD